MPSKNSQLLVKDFKFTNVTHDGTCGYRTVAHHLLGSAEQWFVIVEDSIKWLDSSSISLPTDQKDHILALKETYDNFVIKSKNFKGFCSNTWMSQDFLNLFASLRNVVFLLLKPNLSKRTEFELLWICGDLTNVESKGIYFLHYTNSKWDALTPKPESYNKIVKISKDMISSFADMSKNLDSETTMEDSSAVSSLSESPDLSSEELSARMWQPPDAAVPLPAISDSEEENESNVPLLPAASENSEVFSAPVNSGNISEISSPMCQPPDAAVLLPSSFPADSDSEEESTANVPLLPAASESRDVCSAPVASACLSPELGATSASLKVIPVCLVEKLAVASEKLSKFSAPKSQNVWRIDSLHNCTSPMTFLQTCDRVVNLTFIDTSLRPVKDRTHRYYTASYVQKRPLYNVWQYYAKSAPAQFKSWAIGTILLPVNCEDPPKNWEEYSQRFPENPHPNILGGLWGTNCGKEVVIVGNLQGK